MKCSRYWWAVPLVSRSGRNEHSPFEANMQTQNNLSWHYTVTVFLIATVRNGSIASFPEFQANLFRVPMLNIRWGGWYHFCGCTCCVHLLCWSHRHQTHPSCCISFWEFVVLYIIYSGMTLRRAHNTEDITCQWTVRELSWISKVDFPKVYFSLCVSE